MYRPVRRVQLVNSPLTPAFCPGIRAGAYPPLHLASLAAFIGQHLPQVEVEIIDGELCSVDYVVSRLDADLVGISCNSLTYEAGLQIADAAKRRDAAVVLGGAHPTFAGASILRNRPFVDAVTYGDGELALLGLVNGKAWKEIPNLIYRDGDCVCATQEVNVSLDRLPVPDYTAITLDPYFCNYRALYPDKPFQRALAVYSAKGCQWRDRSGGGCVFCAIQHVGFRIKSVKAFWKELIEARNVWGADFFWDVSDTFTMQRDWVRQFAAEKPAVVDFGFQVYGRTPDIDCEMARLLAHIGVFEVFLGLESGSNETLRAARKGTNVRSNLRAIRNLNREGIRAVISVIIGLPGESEATLAATKNMTEDILSWGDLSEINCSMFLPLPGSHAMTLLNRKQPRRPRDEDLFDPVSLRRTWATHFCDVGYDRLVDVQGQMRKLHRRVGTFGLTVSENVAQLGRAEGKVSSINRASGTTEVTMLAMGGQSDA